MGVPKFYRWISQRYPCINQIVKENEVLPIDHFYLDMNGIIHTSSHCEDMAFKAFDEAKVFANIEDYITYLVALMKPRKTLYLAVDGVAPRAKMTQQRARRFQGPKEAAAELKKRRDKGLEIDESSVFDPNAISPGTEFMARLHEYLKKFIARKIATDRSWQRLDIIYSGHDVPGEGEQKIREYMSYKRSLPEYRPVDKHCLYGMDADLIFLGLATHEPNICILRENVFTAKSAKASDMPFCLVHISLLREYIEMEFKCLEKAISFPYNLERIIDDWILLAYLLGNDFIPHLPNMHIHAESLTILWDTYHVVLPKLDGYLHDFGRLNLDRLHVYLKELSQFDMEWFEEREADQRWMKGKHGERMAKELESLSRFESDARRSSAAPRKSSSTAKSKAAVKPKSPSSPPKDGPTGTAAAVNIDESPAVAAADKEEQDESPEEELTKSLKRVLKLDNAGSSEIENVSTDNLEAGLADFFGDEPASKPPIATNKLGDNRPKSKHSQEATKSSVLAKKVVEHAGSDNCFNGLLIYERTEQGAEEVDSAQEAEEEEADDSDTNMNNDSAEEAEFCDDDDEDFDEDLMAYRMHRKDYYLSKLNIDIRGNTAAATTTRKRGASVTAAPVVEGESTEETEEARLSRVLMPLCSAYIQTLQWILDYYFTAVVDWSFYYPYHYAPFATDLLLFTQRFIAGAPDHGREWTTFRRDSKPMLPFEQQMFIMPPASASIVPEPYRWLLSSHDTPVAEFFPSDFQTDLNGKMASWESVVLIPFIDEERMFAALAPCTARLSASDAARNCHRGNSFFAARAPLSAAEAERATYESLLTEEVEEGFYRAHVLRDYTQCMRVYCSLPRPVEVHFPSLSRLPFKFEIKRIGVQTFSFPSKLESVVITVEHPLCRNSLESSISSDLSLRTIAHRYLGRVASVGWPYARMVLPIIILDENEIFELDLNSLASGGRPIIHDSSHLRTMNPNSSDAHIPRWANLSWLQTHAEWATNRLKDRCAILLPGYPRAALLCRRLDSMTFVARLKSRQGHLQLHPLFTKADLQPGGGTQHRPVRGRHQERGGRTCLRTDANVSVDLGDGLFLELLDLSLEDAGFNKECALQDLFQVGDRVVAFAEAHFGRLAEITGWTPSGDLTLNAEPMAPLAGDPSVLRGIVCEADEQDYLTNKELADRLHLQPPVVAALTDDVMIRAPQFDNDKEGSRRVINVGLAIRPHNSRANTIGWSRFSATRGMWLFSQRVLDVLRKYAELFPELTNYLSGWNCRGVADSNHIFPQDTFASFRRLKDFLRAEVWSHKGVSTADVEWVERNGFSILESSLPVVNSGSTVAADSEPITLRASSVAALLPSGDLLVPDQYLEWLKTVKKKLYVFRLLDRVIYVGPSSELFGVFGVVIGCYFLNGEERLEVLFDKSFVGAISIRDSPCRCAVVSRRHLLHYPTQQGPVQITTAAASSAARPQKLQQQQPAATAAAAPTVTPVFPTPTARPPSPESLRHLYASLPPEWIQAAFSNCPPALSNPWPKPETRGKSSRKNKKHGASAAADTSTMLHHSVSEPQTALPLSSTSRPQSAAGSDRTHSTAAAAYDQPVASPIALVPSSTSDQLLAPPSSAVVTSQPPLLMPPSEVVSFAAPWPGAQSPTACIVPPAPPPCLPPPMWLSPAAAQTATLRQEPFSPQMISSASTPQLSSEGYFGSFNCSSSSNNNNLYDLQQPQQQQQQPYWPSWTQFNQQHVNMLQLQQQQRHPQSQQWLSTLPQQNAFLAYAPTEQAYPLAPPMPPADFLTSPQPYAHPFSPNVPPPHPPPPQLMNFLPTQVLPPPTYSPDFQFPPQAPPY